MRVSKRFAVAGLVTMLASSVVFADPADTMSGTERGGTPPAAGIPGGDSSPGVDTTTTMPRRFMGRELPTQGLGSEGGIPGGQAPAPMEPGGTGVPPGRDIR